MIRFLIYNPNCSVLIRSIPMQENGGNHGKEKRQEKGQEEKEEG
jgi:hypothetical protein